jgi:Cu/Ag efflux pump CusA
MFGNLKDAGLVFLNVPFAIVGGVAALHFTGTNFSISAGIGSESSRPLARVVIGGILCAMIFSLLVFPLIFGWAYRKVDSKHQDPIE